MAERCNVVYECESAPISLERGLKWLAEVLTGMVGKGSSEKGVLRAIPCRDREDVDC